MFSENTFMMKCWHRHFLLCIDEWTKWFIYIQILSAQISINLNKNIITFVELYNYVCSQHSCICRENTTENLHGTITIVSFQSTINSPLTSKY